MSDPSHHQSDAPPVRHCLLVVDDHRDTADTTARLLRLYGYAATEAYGYDAAVAACASRPFDLLFTDVDLREERTGIDLFVHLRDRYGLKGIAYSGHGMPEDRRAALDAGFGDYLLKPATLHDLLAAIARVLGGVPAGRPENAAHARPTPAPTPSRSDAASR